MPVLDSLRSNTDTIISEQELNAKLHSRRKLKVKLGVDPTRPDLTFGHMVVLNKLRQFQEVGHEAILIIGDYTTRIGDPSGRSETRPMLTPDEIASNAASYMEQAFKILDEDRTIVRYNSEWFEKMDFGDCLGLARAMTVARMLERDDFHKRHQSNTPISIVEFLYPLVQGHDSVMLKADVELGGTDQLFNMLVGRQLQKDAGQQEQVVITMPLLVGLDGDKKMSKSQDNYIAFNDSSKDMFGKIMSISDEVMWDYYRLLLEMGEPQIKHWKSEHPMAAKKNLATSLVSQFYSMEVARYELQSFEEVFSKGNQPEDMPVLTWSEKYPDDREKGVVDLIADAGFFESKGEIRRLIKQGAVKVDGIRIEESGTAVKRPAIGESLILQAGKRHFVRVTG